MKLLTPHFTAVSIRAREFTVILVIAQRIADADQLRQAIAAKGALAVSQPASKDRPKLPGRRHSRSHHPMDAISVHTA
jgi:hypothetical protein